MDFEADLREAQQGGTDNKIRREYVLPNFTTTTEGFVRKRDDLEGDGGDPSQDGAAASKRGQQSCQHPACSKRGTAAAQASSNRQTATKQKKRRRVPCFWNFAESTRVHLSVMCCT